MIANPNEPADDWLQALPEALPAPILITRQSDQAILYVNDGFCRLFDVDASSVIGQTATSLQAAGPGYDGLAHMLDMHQTATGGETELHGQDGSAFWVDTSVSSITMHGQPAVLCTFHDITARKASERQVAESAADLKRMAAFPDMNPGPVSRLDPSGTVILANRAAKAILGDDVIGSDWLDVCPGLTQPDWDTLIGTGEPLRHEAQVGDVWLEFVYRYDAEHEVVFVFGSDITERKQFEVEREQQAAAIREMATFPDMNPGPVFRTDPAGAILLANKAARMVFADRELLGQSWLDLCPGMNAAVWSQVLASSEPFDHEVSIGDRAFLFTHTHKQDGDYVFVYGADLTRQKQTETALAQSQKMATLGTLAAGVAHEMNNPAAASQRSAEQMRELLVRLQDSYVMLSRLQLSAEQVEYLKHFDEEFQGGEVAVGAGSPLAQSALEQEIEDWLEDYGLERGWEIAPALAEMGVDRAGLDVLADRFSKEQFETVIDWLSLAHPANSLLDEIREGTQRISEIVTALREYTYVGEAPIQRVDVRKALDNTVTILGSKLSHGITVRRQYDDDLPMIQAYGSELNQVWTAIIDNAVYALEGDGEIVLRASAADGNVVVEIEDDGPGIPKEIQSQVFDSFFTTKPPGAGTGLGLNVSYGIVAEKHNGSLTFESRPGATRFIVTLPIELEAAATQGVAVEELA